MDKFVFSHVPNNFPADGTYHGMSLSKVKIIKMLHAFILQRTWWTLSWWNFNTAFIGNLRSQSGHGKVWKRRNHESRSIYIICGTIYSCVLRSVKFNDMFHDSRISKIDIFLVLTIWMNAPDPLKNLGEKRGKLYICSSSRQFDKKRDLKGFKCMTVS